MPGIVLLDEQQQRELFDDQRQASRSSLERQRRHLQLSNQGLIRSHDDGHVDGQGLPRTDFTTQPRRVETADFTASEDTSSAVPRSDFRSSGNAGHPSKRGLGDTQRTSMTMAMSADFMTRGAAADVPRSDFSYPMLRHELSGTSSTQLKTETYSGGEYAGTSSGLKISVRWIMAGLIVGIGVGILLSETTTSSATARWVSLPGDLFLRALKCLVVPYVFCSVAVAVGDIVFVGKVSVIGLQTAKIYATFWISTAALGVAVALLFRPFFSSLGRPSGLPANAVGFTCADQLLLTVVSNGSVVCSTNATALTNATAFVAHDLNAVFAKNAADEIATLTLSDQIMQTILPIVSSNIVASLAGSELLSIITFSMLLGSIAGHNYFTSTRRVNYLYLTLLQLRNTFFLLMEWTIWLSPLAVTSIVAGSFANNPQFLDVFSHAFPYLLAALSAGLLQAVVVYPLLVFTLTRCNPYTHMRHMVRAYMFAFACASSLATMPVTLSCVKSARMCSQSLANFVISIGVVASTSGMGFYLPIALVFMAESSGNGDQLTVLRIVGMFVLSLLTCAGTPPIPAAGLVVIATAYTTLFGELPVTTFGYVAAMDFFFDRIVTACNINDDIMALKIISETTDETVAQDHLGERF